MANLIDTKFVEEIAFEWNASKRVFQCDTMQIFGREDRESWEFADGVRAYNYQGVWLEFELEFRFAKRKTSGADNDMIDVVNALNNPTIDVTFYPLHDVDVSHSLIVVPNFGRFQAGSIQRLKNIAQYTLPIAAESRQDDYPAWLNNTRVL